jgi:hypothetical protein
VLDLIPFSLLGSFHYIFIAMTRYDTTFLTLLPDSPLTPSAFQVNPSYTLTSSTFPFAQLHNDGLLDPQGGGILLDLGRDLRFIPVGLP